MQVFLRIPLNRAVDDKLEMVTLVIEIPNEDSTISELINAMSLKIKERLIERGYEETASMDEYINKVRKVRFVYAGTSLGTVDSKTTLKQMNINKESMIHCSFPFPSQELLIPKKPKENLEDSTSKEGFLAKDQPQAEKSISTSEQSIIPAKPKENLAESMVKEGFLKKNKPQHDPLSEKVSSQAGKSNSPCNIS